MTKGQDGYHGKRDQMVIMVKGTRWLSWQKETDGYHGKRDQMVIMANGTDGYVKRNQMVIMAKGTDGYHGKRTRCMSW